MESTMIMNLSSVDTLVLILGKSPYKDQNEKIGPYLVLIFDFWSFFCKNVGTGVKLNTHRNQIEGLPQYLFLPSCSQKFELNESLLYYLYIGPYFS